MGIFDKKSTRLWPPWASSMFAPTEVSAKELIPQCSDHTWIIIQVHTQFHDPDYKLKSPFLNFHKSLLKTLFWEPEKLKQLQSYLCPETY